MIEYSARSHVGNARGNNEDNLFVDGVMLTLDMRDYPFAIDGYTNIPAIFAVCDGMGGEENGEVASMAAVQELLSDEGIIKVTNKNQLGNTVQTLVNRMNEAIRAYSLSVKSRMGTTLALAVINKHGIHCFNMGDSRVYALNRGEFKQITHDHTPDGKAGGKLTRCIGIGDEMFVEGYSPIKGNSRLLICSDGLTDMVNEFDIEKTICESECVKEAADHLLSSALANGGQDNVTVIIADIKISGLSFL